MDFQGNKTYSVSELSTLIRQKLNVDFGLIQVTGEVSGLKTSAQGHHYFSLKEGETLIRCVFFRGRNQFAKIAEGQKVHIYCKIDLYEPKGDLQLIVSSISATGQGELYEKFLALKRQLEAQGRFAKSRPLPAFVKRIGIITSPKGAVLHDVLSVLNDHAPHIECILYPCAVQGTGSAPQISVQIDAANQNKSLDLIVLCRGGGSIEDLSVFNSEQVAASIYKSKHLVISAVGHETDFTIADFVADIRAPTPSAAANLLSPGVRHYHNLLNQQIHRLRQNVERKYQQSSQKLDYYSSIQHHLQNYIQEKYRGSVVMLKRFRQVLSYDLSHKMRTLNDINNCIKPLATYQQKYTLACQKLRYLQQQLKIQCKYRQQHLYTFSAKLEQLDIKRQLARGYTLLYHADGKLVKKADNMNTQHKYRLQFATEEVWIEKSSYNKL